MVQLSHLYMTTGKTTALTLQSDLILIVVVQLIGCVLLLVIPMDYAHQTPLSMRRRQEYWSRLPFPSPGDLPDPGIKPASPALQACLSPPSDLTLIIKISSAVTGLGITPESNNTGYTGE